LEAGKGDVNSSRRKTKFLLTEYGEWDYIGSSRLWVDVSLLSLFAGLMRRQESADTPLHSRSGKGKNGAQGSHYPVSELQKADLIFISAKLGVDSILFSAKLTQVCRCWNTAG